MGAKISIKPCDHVDVSVWLELRIALWPQSTREQHEIEMKSLIDTPKRYGQFISCSSSGKPLGFAEVSIRSDYVNGTESFPVAFLEGIFVVPEARQQGIVRALLDEVERWARAAGCRELASDVLFENELSQATHSALGFEETERVVYFRKTIAS